MTALQIELLHLTRDMECELNQQAEAEDVAEDVVPDCIDHMLTLAHQVADAEALVALHQQGVVLNVRAVIQEIASVAGESTMEVHCLLNHLRSSWAPSSPTPNGLGPKAASLDCMDKPWRAATAATADRTAKQARKAAARGHSPVGGKAFFGRAFHFQLFVAALCACLSAVLFCNTEYPRGPAERQTAQTASRCSSACGAGMAAILSQISGRVWRAISPTLNTLFNNLSNVGGGGNPEAHAHASKLSVTTSATTLDRDDRKTMETKPTLKDGSSCGSGDCRYCRSRDSAEVQGGGDGEDSEGGGEVAVVLNGEGGGGCEGGEEGGADVTRVAVGGGRASWLNVGGERSVEEGEDVTGGRQGGMGGDGVRRESEGAGMEGEGGMLVGAGEGGVWRDTVAGGGAGESW